VTDNSSSSSDALESPLEAAGTQGRGTAPTPRLATPATESGEESIQHEHDAVGDGPDVGGLTPVDDAQ